METIAIWNLKGGSGKSVTAYALSSILAERGYRVLALDADQQGMLAKMSGIDPETAEVSLDEIRSFSLPVAEKGFSLVPCNFLIPKEIYNHMNIALKKALMALDSYFDFCIIDSPPHVDAWVENILTAAQKVIVPDHMDATRLPYYPFMNFMNEAIYKVKESSNPNLIVEGILFTEADKLSVRKELLNRAAEQLNTKVFQAQIRYDKILDMARPEKMGKVMEQFVMDDYRAFADELFASYSPI